MKQKVAALVCCRADVEWMALGSDFSRRCRRCLARVIVAPSGVEFLQEHPAVRVVCHICVAYSPMDAYHYVGPAAPDRLEEETATAVRNPHWNGRPMDPRAREMLTRAIALHERRN